MQYWYFGKTVLTVFEKVKSQVKFLEKTGCSDSKQFHIKPSHITGFLFVCFLMLQSEKEAEI